MAYIVEYYYRGDLETLKELGFEIMRNCEETQEFKAYKFWEVRRRAKTYEYIIIISRFLVGKKLYDEPIQIIKYCVEDEEYSGTHLKAHLNEMMEQGLVERQQHLL